MRDDVLGVAEALRIGLQGRDRGVNLLGGEALAGHEQRTIPASGVPEAATWPPEAGPPLEIAYVSGRRASNVPATAPTSMPTPPATQLASGTTAGIRKTTALMTALPSRSPS